jgi:hypothetical protein
VLLGALYQIAVSVSSLFLCKIFWLLGTKVESAEPLIVETEEETWDEDAEMQAELWN